MFSGFMERLYYNYDIDDNEDSIVFKFIIPGVKKEDISINRFDDRIILEAGKGTNKKTYKIPLKSEYVELTNETAKYDNGVLEITLQKEKIKGKNIPLS